jgi:lysozyme
MAKPTLAASRAIWRARENYRYGQWFKYRHQTGTPAVHSERAKWWVLYSEAHQKRVALDRKLAQQKAKFSNAREVSDHGANFIKHFEGFSGTIYHDSVGVPTVGYGHTENVHPGAVWVKGQRTPGRLTEAEATTLLHNDLNLHYAPTVRALGVKLDQNEFDALTSFVYNVGVGGVSTSTHVGKNLRDKNYRAAANSLLEWDKAGGKVLQGLLNRREAERTLFLT